MDEQSVEHCVGTLVGLYIRFNHFVLAKITLRLATRFLQYGNGLQAVSVWRLHSQVLHKRKSRKCQKVMAENMAGGQHTSWQAASYQLNLLQYHLQGLTLHAIPEPVFTIRAGGS